MTQDPMNDFEQDKMKPFWLWPVPETRRCQARSKRTGKRCLKWACKDRLVCRVHGGLSTGPTTIEGRLRLVKSKVKHGKYSLVTKKKNLFRKICKKLDPEILTESRIKRIQEHMEQMTWQEFKSYRRKVNNYFQKKQK